MRNYLQEIRCRQYSKYFLSRNPFPYTSVPSEQPSFYAGNGKTLRTLIDALFSTMETGISNHAVIVGPYGTGKSHTMKYLKTLLEKDNSFEKPALACYINHLGPSFLNIYQQIVDEIGFGRIKILAESPQSDDPKQNVTTALRLISQGEIEAWRWLRGEKIESKRLSRMGIDRNMDEYSAVNTLKNIVNQTRKHYSLLCILIDELESINEMNFFHRQRLFNNLRNLIDETPIGVSLVFGCTPAGWDEILENAPALTRRLSRNVVYLGSLSEHETKRLVATYISRQRKNKEALKEMLKNPECGKFGKYLELYPFTKKALRMIAKLSRGNIGEVLKYCNLIIDLGLDCSQEQIDSSFIMKSASRHGW